MSNPYPSVRRVISKFSRPTVALPTNHRVRREWQSIPAKLLRAGDIIAQHGLIHMVERFTVEPAVFVTCGEDWHLVDYAPDEEVFAFTASAAPAERTQFEVLGFAEPSEDGA